MNRIIQFLLALLLVFSGFTNYGFNGILNIPVIIGLLLLAAVVLDMCLNRYRFRFSRLDAIFLFVIAGIGLANYYLRGPQYINLNHLYAICFCYLVFYCLPYLVFTRFQVSVEKILLWIIIGLLLSAVLGSIETGWQELFNKRRGLLPSLTYVKRNLGTFLLFDQRFFRIRGGMDEPNAFMLYFGTFLPLAIYYFARLNRAVKPVIKGILAVFTVIVVIFAFSSGWLVSLLAAAVVYAAFELCKTRGKIPKGFKKAAAAVLGIYALGFSFFNGLIRDTLLKFSSGFNHRYPDTRLNRWNVVLTYWANNLNIAALLFGFGPGFISETEMIWTGAGVVNLYIKLGVEWGLVGLAVFLGLLFYHLYLANKSEHDMQGWLVFALLYIMIYYLCSDNFYYPVLWLLLAIIKYTCQEKYASKGELL